MTKWIEEAITSPEVITIVRGPQTLSGKQTAGEKGEKTEDRPVSKA